MTPRRLVFTIVVPIVLSLSLASGASLPTELTDSEFWRIVSDFSEESGYFRFENFLSNELDYQSVIPAMKETTKPGGVYLGVGPEQNFTYIAALQPGVAFIFDIRRQNMLELLMYKAVFEMSSDRADFVSRLFSLPRPAGLTDSATAEEIFKAFATAQQDPDLFATNLTGIHKRLLEEHRFKLSAEDVETIDYVYEVFFESGPGLDYTAGGGARGSTYAELMSATDADGQARNFLASEENFRFIREMQRKNLIVPLVGDFAGPKAIRAVAQYLREHEAVVSAFYTSNVEQYLFQQDDDWSRFYSNVAALPMDSTSQFIRASRFAYPAGPRQLMRDPSRGDFLLLLSPMQELIKIFEEGHIESYNQVIQMSR